MPAWEPGKGMTDYVKGRNRGPQVEEFKLQAPNIAAARHGSQHPLRHGARRSVIKSQQPFYETDVSDLDETLTNASKLSGGPGEQSAARPPSDGSEGGESDEDDDDEALHDNPLHNAGAISLIIGGNLTSKQLQMLAQHEGQNVKIPDATALGVMKGDSYPTSTSGPASVVSGDETALTLGANRRPNTSAVAEGQSSIQHWDMRTPLGTPPGLQFGPARQPQHRGQPLPVARKDVRGHDALSPTPAADRVPVPEADFRYRRRDDLAQPIAQPSGIAQHAGKLLSAQMAPITPSHDAQRGSRVVLKDPRSASPHTRVEPAKVQVTAESDAQHLQPQTRLRSPLSVPPHRESRDPALQQHNRPDFSSGNAADDDEQQINHENELDYEMEQLREMDYHALKSQSFDTDPNATNATLRSVEPPETLANRLSAVGSRSTQDQNDFFASLALDDWEEAGGWFLDRFGEIVSSFKAARQDKRKAARQFEDEIERRYDAVSRKRKSTEDALGAMKQSGTQVLLSTPKKARATT